MTLNPRSSQRPSKFWALTRLESTLSPASWLLLNLGAFVPLWAIFRPCLRELLCLLAVSLLDLWAIQWLDRWCFVRANPPVLPAEILRPLSRLDTLSLNEKVAWAEQLIGFPARRARHCLRLSALKSVPEILVVVFVWTHARGPLHPLACALVIALLLATYFYGMIYIENHAFISDLFAELHRRYDWSSVFARVQPSTAGRHFRTHDYASLTAIGALTLFAECNVILTNSLSRELVAANVIAIGIVGGLLMSWLWFSSRDIFLSGLWRLFDELANFDPENTTRSLPLHSTPMLARFEKAFNTLLSRLRSYQRELHHRVYLKTEESRYQALGEMAGLVVHDLSTPLHIIRFCLEQIEETREPSQERYFQQLQRSSQRAVELVESLRAYIRNPREKEVSVTYSDAQGHVMRLLEVQFYSRGLSNVEFEIDCGLTGLSLRLAKADLIHVLINLYANSIENLLANETVTPKISVKLEENRGKQVLLSFRDNGTGLSAEAFERLTALNPEPENLDRGSLGGLGLRLVRRLIERYHGSLTVVNLPPEEKGTLFHIWVPSVPSVEA